MPKISGFTMYECDRPGKVHKNGQKPAEWIKPEDIRNSGWFDGSYVDANGVELPIILCPACAAQFEEIEKGQRGQMTAFANGAV